MLECSENKNQNAHTQGNFESLEASKCIGPRILQEDNWKYKCGTTVQTYNICTYFLGGKFNVQCPMFNSFI